ncbi:MAG: S46 family peptidase [Salinibacter sp.]|uniref:S46 family peptidase n=1 Tax=Salinibacter sp. TaxID=2065818 RepID=UPI0035D40F9A
MTLRSTSLTALGFAILLLFGGGVGHALWAQDRGAPRFGPAALGDTTDAEAVAAGRLWSVATPPFDRFDRRYEVKADSAWATHVRRGLLRLPHCTAALVSAQGLALTTARCVRRHLQADQQSAFVAEEQGAERPVPEAHADRLVAAEDVTTEVQAAQQDRPVQQAVRQVQKRRQSEAKEDRRVEVVSAAGGARYTAYTYRRYEDVRLVFLPNRAISTFGGVEAAFTYPRYALNAALVRVYDRDGTAFTPTHFFETATQGRRPGDAVFAAGYARGTHRDETADQLAFRRDVTLPIRRSLLDTWTQTVQSSLDDGSVSPSRWRRDLRRGQRALKATRARLEALQTDSLMAQLQERDARVQRLLRRDPSTGPAFEGVLDSLATIQSAKRELASAYRAFEPLESGPYVSSTLRRAVLAHRARQADGALRDSLARRMADVPPQPASIDTELLAFHLEALRAHLQPDSAAVRRLLRGASPEERAASVVEASTLATDSLPGPRSGKATLPPEDDPALTLVDAFAAPYRSFRESVQSLTHAENRLTRRWARARYDARRRPVLPAVSGAPRLTDGRLQGYPYNGTLAPPFTTLFGLLGQARAFSGEAWTLPEAWRASSDVLDRSTPLNMTATVDPAAATPGAPLLNRYLEIVGVAMGPNVQGVAGTYLYLPERMRTVAVDLRGIRQALATVHGAESLVSELFGTAADPGGTSR